MSFDYERDTRAFYQDDATARRYDEMFTAPRGWRNLPSRVVARRERRAIAAALARVPHASALDLPTGTGKLAGVFAALGTRVVAADVSASMLARARAQYASAGAAADCRVLDAGDLSVLAPNAFDVVVCLRLLHRVPPALRARMLREFARVAPFALVTFGIETRYHRTRRAVRAALFGGRRAPLCFCSRAEAEDELAVTFDVLSSAWIAPAVSQEMLFALRARRAPSAPAAGA